jgi:hypothetical protein
MEEKKENYVLLKDEELATLSAGIQFPGTKLIIWLLSKIAPEGII